jgi:tetratricopeptide (TPR) repeat protein
VRLAPIKSRVPLGSVIRVSLYLGESHEGTLLDIDDECLIISGDGSEVILEANAIAAVHRVVPATGDPVSSAGPPSKPAPAPAPSAPDPVVFPPAATLALGELERAVRETKLEVNALDWQIYTDDLDAETRTLLTRDLVAIQNRYRHALMTKDKGRIRQCVDGLRELADDYNAQDALQVAGQILWHSGELEEARGLFAEAADALNDASSCFDLAMAQRATGEGERAPKMLRNCVTEKSSDRSLALWALTAIVLSEGTGRAELAGLVRDAGSWRPCPARLAVLHCGLLCVSRPGLTGFPAGQWDSPNLDESAFALLAQTLHANRALSARPVQAAEAAVPAEAPSAVPAKPAASPGAAARPSALPQPAADVNELRAKVYISLNRKDVAEAEQALAELKRAAPSGSVTWQAEQAVAYARSAANPKSGSGTGTGSISAHKQVVHYSTQSNSVSTFQRAEDALKRRNNNQARQLYELAIAGGDNPTRAVRRLAELLATRLKNRNEAIEVLEAHKSLFVTKSDRWAWSQLRSTICEHAGRWQEAAAELRDMLDRAPTHDDRIKVLKRTTAALIKTFEAEEARDLLERELAAHPDELALQAILDQLNQALVTGVFSTIEATLQSQAESASELSPLLRFHLERCQYWGVRADSLASREFSEDDIEWLDNLVSGRRRRLGKDRPRERAEANLSAARIMQDLGITDDGFRRRLRSFGAAMGDACVLDAKGNADVIRAYYSEAVSVRGEWDDTVTIMLKQLVMSFVQTDVQLLDVPGLPTLETALVRVMSEPHLTEKVLVTLLALPTQGESATRLINWIWNDKATREIVQKALASHLGRLVSGSNQRSFTAAWLQAAEQDRDRRKVYRQITALTEAGAALPVLDRHSDQLKRISQEMNDLASTTDLVRIADCQAVVTSLREYMSQTAYVERERLFGTVRSGIRDKVREFEEAPTVVSLGVLHPYLLALKQEVEENFAQYAANAEPDDLAAELVLDRYLPGDGSVTVQLQVSNGPDASPVSNVELEVIASDDYYTGTRDVIPVAESIGAGDSRTCLVSLVASRRAIEQELVTLNCRVHFTLRSGRRVTAPARTFSVRLHPDEEWADIPNPYSAGLPVENPDMFKGRDRMIAELIETVSRSGASVVVHGQKRAGKSSVLYHLKQNLTRPLLAVNLSMLELAGTVTFADLLFRIGIEFHRKVSDEVEALELDAVLPAEPDLAQIRQAPLPTLIDYMLRLQRWLKRVPELADCQLILLIDEFSVIHRNIRVGELPSDFMKGWKALLEKGFFRCVLVGNDLMPQFISEFPNEFQVALTKRVSYLDEIYARQLIEEPIRLADQTSRYRGNAVDRILELTGRSPYYIQLFCQRLVHYMNREDVRAPTIGPADVDAVARQLIFSELGRNEFDNLLTPGDSEVSDIRSTLVIDVLRATRRESGPNMYHEVNPDVNPEEARVMEDLLRREVVKRLSGNRYRIQVGIFSEWLQHQWG